jgi:hypothetical protein
VKWFARARARRQVDRSELRVLQIPRLIRRGQHANDINDAGIEYLASVKTYFEPIEIKKPRSRARVNGKTPSASSFTEARLHILQYWSRLSPGSQRVFAAEEFIESRPSQLQELVIEKLLEAAADVPEPDIAQHLQSVAREAGDAFGDTSKGMQDAILAGRFSWVVDGFHWREILGEHIESQCAVFSSSMRDVQKAYFRFRILSD